MDSETDSAFMQSSSASNKDENNQSDQDNKLPTTNEADNTTGNFELQFYTFKIK